MNDRQNDIPEPSLPAEAFAATTHEVWIVFSDEPEGKTPVGALVTTRDRLPKPVAFVPRADPPGLLSASLIASGKGSPETEQDLRARHDARLRFVGKLLVPLDFVTRKNRECVAAKFIQIADGAEPNFVAFSDRGLRAAMEKAIERKIRDSSREHD